MRISTIVAKIKSGAWVTLAQPDVPLVEQKQFFKQLKLVNGKGVLFGNERVDLDEAHLMVSGNGKRIRFKPEVVEAVEEDGGVKNLKELKAALGIEDEKEFDALRKAEGFPGEKDEAGCYDVEAIRAFAAQGSEDGDQKSEGGPPASEEDGDQKSEDSPPASEEDGDQKSEDSPPASEEEEPPEGGTPNEE